MTVTAAPAPDLVDAVSADAQALMRADGHPLCLLTLVGSRAYGLERPDSDVDVRGVYQFNQRELFSLVGAQDTFRREQPDFAAWEAGRFLRMAAKCNPQVLEMLYGPVLHTDPVGELLLANRHLALSELVRAAYTGFAYRSFKDAARGNRGTSDPAQRRKHLLHAFRLLDSGRQLLEHGEMDVRVSDPAELAALAALDDRDVAEEFTARDAHLKAMPTRLCYSPDWDALNALAHKLRATALGLDPDSPVPAPDTRVTGPDGNYRDARP